MASKTLYCVLNWGLGHASRSIPIIQELIAEHHDIAIAADGHALTLLQNAFPHLQSFQLPSYDITYKYQSIAANIIGQCFKIIRSIKAENKVIKKLIEEHKFTRIISDNRFGCHHLDCENIFITHQLRLIHPNRFIQASATKLNLRMMANFQEVWIPDEEGALLSGKMSSGVKMELPHRYIGIKSRFSQLPLPVQPTYHSVSILSGPEPQRTYLQEKLTDELTQISGQHAIVTGLPAEQRNEHNITYYGLCDVAHLSQLISQSTHIISRSGYSSIMDYEAMGRKAMLIPTPGQTEQEYLGALAGASGRHIVLNQNSMNLQKMLT